MRVTFSSDKDVLNRPLELGYEEIHKNKDKVLSFEKEKELHNYLSK